MDRNKITYANNSIKHAIDRLTEISSDINKMLAVHEERLNSHEKKQDNLEDSIEKRRSEISLVTNDLYGAIEKNTENIFKEIKDLSDESKKQHDKLKERMISFEKYIWMAIGASIAVSWLFSFISNYHTMVK